MATTTREASSSDRVAEQLRQLIVTGQLSPGEHIRQEQMAGDLGVSRAPLREALKLLLSEGLVRHTHNAGYSVVRLSQEQFNQIYVMRRLLETEVIARFPRASPAVLAQLRDLNEGVRAASAALDLHEMQRLNHEFHFVMFDLSGLGLVVGELDRLWRWAMPYHAVYLYDSTGRDRSLAEHDLMLDALEAGDNAALARVMASHREGSEQHLGVRFRTTS